MHSEHSFQNHERPSTPASLNETLEPASFWHHLTRGVLRLPTTIRAELRKVGGFVRSVGLRVEESTLLQATTDLEHRMASTRRPRSSIVKSALAMAAISSSLVLGFMGSTAGAAIGTSAWSDVTPPEASPGYAASGLNSVSCPTRLTCFGVGEYENALGRDRPMGAKQLAGSWFKAVDISPPADAQSNPQAALNSIDCPSATTCWAVGSYVDQALHQQAMAVKFTAGSWRQAIKVSVPADSAGTASLVSIACPTSTTCIAVGSYRQTNTGTRAIFTTLQGGVWKQAKAARMPKDASSSFPSAFTSISCQGASDCWAVGSYLNSRPATAPMGDHWQSGSLGRAIALPYPNDAFIVNTPPTLSSISCSRTGGCLAAGTYVDGPNTSQGFNDLLRSNLWSTNSRRMIMPADAKADPALRSVQVACAAKLQCVVSGNYVTTSPSFQTFFTDFHPGLWGVPTGIASEMGFASVVFGIACHTATACTAVGGGDVIPFEQKATSINLTR